MFCNQCEQTVKGGCTKIGVCGKNEDIASLQNTMIFGLKGIAAYAYHAREFGYRNKDVDGFVHRALYATLTNVNFSMEDHFNLLMDTGKNALSMMELLDEAYVEQLGVPVPAKVTQNKVEGKAILVTGHDLFALKQLLEQSKNSGVNVYTHSEMLPAHGYPKLKEYQHLKGNVGGAWHDQRRVFEKFNGAILGTSNCVMPVPAAGKYGDRMFTYGVAGLEGVKKIENDDFKPLIEKALSLPDSNVPSSETLATGYHHANLPKILDFIKYGKLKRIFVIAGCDATTPGRDYYRKLALAVPKDCIILASACGKYRFNDADFGNIDGMPRLMDVGQCNNSVSFVKIAQALSQAMECPVNDLPLTIVLSWFEQKAVAILLALLSLGVKNVYLGPRLPEFLSPNVAKMLVDKFDLKLIGDPEDDLKKMLGTVE